jgi:HAD superfamily hydrolase (TIGR01549 family)
MKKHIDLSNIRSMMFDLDGTLIDSIPTYFDLMDAILKAVGLPPAPRSLIAEFMTEGLKGLEKMIPEEMSDQKDELIQECITVGRKMSWNMFNDKVQLFAGVPELFSLLVDRKILMGVVTSTQRRAIDRKLAPLARGNIKDMLNAVIAIEDAPERKPAPDPLLECARRLNVAAEQCVYVGDSHVDIRAGNAAGMMTIGVLTGLDDYETLKREDPSMIVESVNEIRRLLEGG